MATTSLFVEIIVIGSLAELWFVAFLAALQPPGTVSPLVSRILQSDATGAAIVGMLLAVTYAVGWVVNFVCERVFKTLFEKRLRDNLFQGSSTAYQEPSSCLNRRMGRQRDDIELRIWKDIDGCSWHEAHEN